MPTPDTDDSGLSQRLRDATELLESIAANHLLLDHLTADDRQRFHLAIAQVYNPDPVARRLTVGILDVRPQERRGPGPGPTEGPVVRGEVVDDD